MQCHLQPNPENCFHMQKYCKNNAHMLSRQQRLYICWHLLGLDGEADQLTRHHALETAEVDVCAAFQQVKDLVSVLLNLILDVHLAALLVLLLT